MIPKISAQLNQQNRSQTSFQKGYIGSKLIDPLTELSTIKNYVAKVNNGEFKALTKNENPRKYLSEAGEEINFTHDAVDSVEIKKTGEDLIEIINRPEDSAELKTAFKNLDNDLYKETKKLFEPIYVKKQSILGKLLFPNWKKEFTPHKR